jgi:transcriptional regulator with XRE-family HTH domain
MYGISNTLAACVGSRRLDFNHLRDRHPSLEECRLISTSRECAQHSGTGRRVLNEITKKPAKPAAKPKSELADASLQKRFGQRIQELRMKRGYSQEELASLAGVNRTYLSDIERGLGNATLDVINRLSSSLEIELAQLFAGLQPAARDLRVLVAATTHQQEQVRKLLGGAYELVGCTQLKEAGRLLEEGEFDVVLCDTQFSQGEMFDLLRIVRLSNRHREVPFVSVEFDQRGGRPVLTQAMQIAVMALGGTTLVQLNEPGAEDGEIQLIRAVESVLSKRSP